MALPSVAEREAQIRAYAKSIGIDPEIAVQVARSEGLTEGTWQSDLQQPYGRERSFGDFQLHLDPTGKRPGMGNSFQTATGLDPSDPANWQAMNRYALDQAKAGGWSPWMGAKKVGVTGFKGIGQAPPEQKAMGTAMGGFAAGPASVQARMDTGQVAGLLEDPAAPAPHDWSMKDFGTFGSAVSDFAKTQEEDQPQEMIQGLVFQPLRRVQLKGLLS